MHEKEDLTSFYQAMHKAINELRKWPTKTVTLVHHDDGDGLCSAAITKAALEREGFEVKALCLEKVFPEVPGYGRLKQKYAKVSVRVPKEMRKLIDADKTPPAVKLLVEASKNFGITDGHAYAASCILSAEIKQNLIGNAEKFLET